MKNRPALRPAGARRAPAAALLALLALTGCGSWEYEEGEFYEKKGNLAMAVKAFERFAIRHPDDPKTARALIRAADIYAKDFHRCLEARRGYETALRRFPELGEPWESRARAGIMDCPDFFPLEAGRTWVFGDTASRGKNMRLELEVSESTGPAAVFSSRLFAGAKNIKSEKLSYAKNGWILWEETAGRRVAILRYPFSAGLTWTERNGGNEVEYRIESADATAETAAGLFSGCLKVKEHDKRFAGSWKYDYYAPYVGRVKTTIGGPGYENPNTELLRYSGP